MLGASEEKKALTKWLDFWASPELIARVANTIANEKKERIYDNKDAVDYGYSFPGLNNIKQSCLETVRNICEAEGRKAVVADLGAGFGNMTWKLLAAGARVDAFELKQTAALEIKRKLSNLSPDYWQQKPLKSILNVFCDNILSALNQEQFKEKYDVVWVGNVFHFLNPDEMKLMSRLLHHILKPQGRIFAEANSVEMILNHSYDNKHVLSDAIARAKAANIPFPGFVAVNMATLCEQKIIEVQEHWGTTMRLAQPRIVGMTFVSAYNQNEMTALGIEPKTNGYGKNFLVPSTFNAEARAIVADLEQQCNTSLSMMMYNPFYKIFNYLDEETVKLVFQQAGFTKVTTKLVDTRNQYSKSHGLDIVANKGFIITDEVYDINQTDDEMETLCKKPTFNRSILVESPSSTRFRRPYSLSIFALEPNNENKVQLFSVSPQCK